MNPPAHRSDQPDSWFQHDSAPDHRSVDAWDADGASTGSLSSAPEGHGATTPEASARHLAADDASTTPWQHAERVPRYTGMSVPGTAPPVAGVSGPPVAPASSGLPASREAATAGPASPGADSPTMAQPVISPSGIPPSLAPMLGHEQRPTLRHTETIPGGGQRGQQPMTGSRPGGMQSAGGASRNPAVRVAVVLVTLLAAVPSLLLLHQALFQADLISESGVVGGTLMLIGLPMCAAGLLPLIGGGTPVESARSLLRPPLVYLMTGVALLLAAGIAAG